MIHTRKLRCIVYFIFSIALLTSSAYSYSKGDTISLGTYPYAEDGTRRPLDWIILGWDSDGSALLLSKYVIDNIKYSENNSKSINKPYVTWENSTVKVWLNGFFYNSSFSGEDKEKISLSFLANKDNSEYGTNGGGNTQDKIFLLSEEEIKSYLSENKLRLALATPYAERRGAITNRAGSQNADKELDSRASLWAIRTPGHTHNDVAYILANGNIDAYGKPANKQIGIRAALRLKPGILPKPADSSVPASDFKDDINFPYAKQKNVYGVAVIIGVRNYENNVPAVEYAMNDAQSVKKFVSKTLGYDAENIIYVENPTKGKMEEIFGTQDDYKGMLYDYVKNGKSDVLVYYSGHGASDIKSRAAYFVPKEANPDYIRHSGYAMATLYGNLAKLPARKIIVATDACFSGQAGNGQSIIKKASPLNVSPKIPISTDDVSVNSKMLVFNAGRSDEIASWYDDKKHGMFTYYFLLGLSGAADKDGDKTITAGEMDEYLQQTVPYRARRMYHRSQTPMFIGNKDDVIAAYR